MNAPLFPTCPLPGCRNLTDDARTPCEECLDLFGPHHLRPARQEVSEEDFAEKLAAGEEQVARVLTERRTVCPAEGWRRNQACWVCTERRTCRPDADLPDRWICGSCLGVS